MHDDVATELADAGRALARHGLVDAFGHVSVRDGDALRITAPVPLATMTADAARRLTLDGPDLPSGTPKEAWIHREIAAARPDVGAICRAQPPTATALAAAGVPVLPLHGQGAFLGPRVPVHPDPRLVRDRDGAVRLARTLGQGWAVILRGNGAVTVGADIAEAVGRMWVLERSARMNATAAAAGSPAPLDEDEQSAWRDVAPELLHRIWRYLKEEER
ncbi:class II aldolase/adducin family protein [Georgenia yuyongxinii]|uniref:Class II aldolase/adducin family protein n=1 Tax=Georgenia yuyongxinii TaxID=2589797 RepID=A0A552WNB1_9MICO|nr:class II aldolase/adducin family protein [Georgenia yuyongxinii]TRW44251.1 class II aldolase/adducin family protein [Georgenia yuyongxinii]